MWRNSFQCAIRQVTVPRLQTGPFAALDDNRASCLRTGNASTVRVTRQWRFVIVRALRPHNHTHWVVNPSLFGCRPSGFASTCWKSERSIQLAWWQGPCPLRTMRRRSGSGTTPRFLPGRTTPPARCLHPLRGREVPAYSTARACLGATCSASSPAQLPAASATTRVRAE
jgi:hypothetical protein